MKILFVTPRLPWPPYNGGDRLRNFELIRRLSARHEIHLFSNIEKAEDDALAANLRPLCRQVVTQVVSDTPELSWLQQVGPRFFSQLDYASYLNIDDRTRRKLEAITEREEFDLVYVSQIIMAPYFERFNETWKVIDLIDAFSLAIGREAAAARGVARWLKRWEAYKTGRHERRLLRLYDGAMVVSPRDRDHISRGDARIAVVPLGSPIDIGGGTGAAAPRPGAEILFVGHMAHLPNVEGVRWFIDNCWPRVKAGVPQARLTIVGLDPAPELLSAAAADPAITVTGYVPSIEPFLDRARLMICPMLSGSGIKIKVLAAMAHGLPVVATSIANEGILATPGRELVVADDAQSYADAVVRLAGDDAAAAALAENAREFCRERYSWNRIVDRWHAEIARWTGIAGREARIAREPHPLVSVVIVSYNGAHLLRDCLPSLRKQRYGNFETVVVDNGSTDGTAELLALEFPEVRLVRSERNLGFAGGNNLGVRHCAGQLVALLNNDTTVPGDWLGELVDELVRNPSTAVAGSMVYNENIDVGRQRTAGAPNMLGMTIDNVYRDPGGAKVLAVSGCGLIFRRDLLGLPFLDEYFAYFEDTYLCRRALLMGYKTVLVRSSVVQHKGGVTAGKLFPLVILHSSKNRLLNIVLFHSWRGLTATLPLAIALEAWNTIKALVRLAVFRRPEWVNHFYAYGWLIGNLPWIVRQRRRLQAERVIPHRQMYALMTSRLVNRKGAVGDAVNGWFRAYFRLWGIRTYEDSSLLRTIGER